MSRNTGEKGPRQLNSKGSRRRSSDRIQFIWVSSYDMHRFISRASIILSHSSRNLGLLSSIASPPINELTLQYNRTIVRLFALSDLTWCRSELDERRCCIDLQRMLLLAFSFTNSISFCRSQVYMLRSCSYSRAIVGF